MSLHSLVLQGPHTLLLDGPHTLILELDQITGYAPPFHSTAFTVRPQDSQLVSVGTSRLVVADHHSVLAVRSHLSIDLKAD